MSKRPVLRLSHDLKLLLHSAQQKARQDFLPGFHFDRVARLFGSAFGRRSFKARLFEGSGDIPAIVAHPI